MLVYVQDSLLEIARYSLYRPALLDAKTGWGPAHTSWGPRPAD